MLFDTIEIDTTLIALIYTASALVTSACHRHFLFRRHAFAAATATATTTVAMGHCLMLLLQTASSCVAACVAAESSWDR